jgi:hypothetical protein
MQTFAEQKQKCSLVYSGELLFFSPALLGWAFFSACMRGASPALSRCSGTMEERSMVHPGNKASDTERELRAYSDELGIRRHAERLEADLGADRALRVLEEITRAIAARRSGVSWAVIKPGRK